MSNINFKFENMEESKESISKFKFCLNKVLNGYDYSNFLDNVIFTKDMSGKNHWENNSKGSYQPSKKQIVIKLGDNNELTIFHELLHVKFTIDNLNLMGKVKLRQQCGLDFINEYIARRDSEKYFFENSSLKNNIYICKN